MIDLRIKSFDSRPIVAEVTAGAEVGVRRAAEEAADIAKSSLVAPTGRGAEGLSVTGYGSGEISQRQYPHQASGTLLASIRSQGQGLSAVASTDVEYAAELNYGRMPGREVAPAELEAWANQVGFKGDLVALANRIKERGMAATGFWTAAENHTDLNAADVVAEEVRKRL